MALVSSKFLILLAVLCFVLILITESDVAVRSLKEEMPTSNGSFMSNQEKRGLVPPAGPSPCTYIPGRGHGGHCPPT